MLFNNIHMCFVGVEIEHHDYAVMPSMQIFITKQTFQV